MEENQPISRLISSNVTEAVVTDGVPLVTGQNSL
jgi:hypothetical protein